MQTNVESSKTLSARVATILGGLVLSTVLGFGGMVWNYGRVIERMGSDLDHAEFRMAQLESDCREFRKTSVAKNELGHRELRNELVACRNRIESEIATIRVGPSRYEAQGHQIKGSLGDFRQVQKDVLHRLRMAESTISMLLVKGSDSREKNDYTN